MCHLTETYYTHCSHFGARMAHTLCARGATHPGCATTGCWDSTVDMLSRIDALCAACKLQDQAGRTSVVEIRDEKSRGEGADKGVWLKSFGGWTERGVKAEGEAEKENRLVEG